MAERSVFVHVVIAAQPLSATGCTSPQVHQSRWMHRFRLFIEFDVENTVKISELKLNPATYNLSESTE